MTNYEKLEMVNAFLYNAEDMIYETLEDLAKALSQDVENLDLYQVDGSEDLFYKDFDGSVASMTWNGLDELVSELDAGWKSEYLSNKNSL